MTRRRVPIRVLVIGHRGASARAPENTAAAVRLAVKLGADAVECDVQLSKDSVPIVFHDDDLRRLCGERGRVCARPAAVLLKKRVRVDGRTGSPARILTLAQWLRLLPGRVMPVVELKRQASAAAEDRLAEAAAAVLARRRGRIAVISFSPRLVRRMRELLPKAWAGPVVDRPPRGGRQEPAWFGLARPIAALSRAVATRALVARLRRAGRQVWCWTVDEPAEMRSLVARGVAGIISNAPDVARRTLTRQRSGSASASAAS